MPSRKTSLKKKPPSGNRDAQIGPRIVRAWFDTVINPLLRALETEQKLLADKDWTWRFRPGGLETIRPANRYIDSEARENLEHFSELKPKIGRALGVHDERVSFLVEQCKKLHQAIKLDDVFRELYFETTSEESLSKLGTSLTTLFGAYQSGSKSAFSAAAD